MGIWRYEGVEIWRYEGMEVWRYGDMGGRSVHGPTKGHLLALPECRDPWNEPSLQMTPLYGDHTVHKTETTPTCSH